MLSRISEALLLLGLTDKALAYTEDEVGLPGFAKADRLYSPICIQNTGDHDTDLGEDTLPEFTTSRM